MYGIGAREGADREHARPPLRLRRREAGADRQRRLRPAPERRLGRAARLDLPARKGAARARHPDRPRADPLPGRSGDRRLAPPRPGDLGVARRAPALRLLEADDLGRGRPRRPPRPRRSASTSSPSEWQAKADEFKAEILERGVRDGVFRQHYETDALDASLLLIPLFRFLPPDDPRVRATVDAIADDLTEHGLVLRYKVEETDDGLHGEEGTFLICSFWLVSALSEIGERAARPRALRAAARGGRLARPLRRGARRRVRPPPRQLPPGLHPPGPDQRGLPRDRRRAARGRRRHRGLQRDGRGPRGRLSRARRTCVAVDKRSTDNRFPFALYCRRSWHRPDRSERRRPADRPRAPAAPRDPARDGGRQAGQPARARRRRSRQPLSNVSYHVRVLADCGAVDAGREPSRSAARSSTSTAATCRHRGRSRCSALGRDRIQEAPGRVQGAPPLSQGRAR